MNRQARYDRSRSQDSIPLKDLSPQDKEKIIKNGDGELINKWGDTLGKQYKDISTSKIRKFFGGIERMSGFQLNELHLLRPQLAYVVGKEKDKKVIPLIRHFRKEIDSCINIVNSENEFMNLKHFLESIIAYHRFYGGRE